MAIHVGVSIRYPVLAKRFGEGAFPAFHPEQAFVPPLGQKAQMARPVKDSPTFSTGSITLLVA